MPDKTNQMDYRNAHKAHPWHGISLGKSVPEEVRAFIEIVPTDTVKYEVDKESGYLSSTVLRNSPISFRHFMVSFREHIAVQRWLS